MLNCDGKLKDDENWMNAETSWVRDVAKGQIWRTTSTVVMKQQLHDLSAILCDLAARLVVHRSQPGRKACVTGVLYAICPVRPG